MQPPPRKVKETQEAKLVFAEQVSCLQAKHQVGSELLEDMRTFAKQRAAIEKEYGQALQRLALQYQRRDWYRAKGDQGNPGSVFAVWRTLMEATTRSGTTRVNASESYRSLAVEAMKNLQTAQEHRAKRGLERLQMIQGELVDEIREVNKVKKRYWQLSHIADVAREKAADAQARSKKSDQGLFHFRSSVQKMCLKLSARLTECDQRLTEVRNEYLLALAAVNSFQQHYISVELPAVMKDIDGDYFDQLREQFCLLCRAEIDICQSTQNEFLRVQKDAAQVTREKDLEVFLQESSTFSHISPLVFQLAANDKVDNLQKLSSTQEHESSLDKEARKWAAKAAKDYKITAHGERALHTLEKRRTLLGPEEAGPGLQQKIEEVKENVRKAQVSRVKAQARLDLLALAGADAEHWFGSSMRQAEEDLETERRLSEARRSNGDTSSVEDEFDFTDFEDSDESGDAFVDPDRDPVPSSYPFPCRVLYSYKGCQADELSIIEGEELQIIEDGDMEDWLKARNAAGQVGYVPERYLQFHQQPAEGAVANLLPGSPQLNASLSSSDSFPGLCRREQGQMPQCGVMLRALYDYHGQSAEELSFPEGALIQLRRCRHGDIDDGFWEGELDGRIGVFPSLVVEMLGDGEEEQDEEDKECPPTPTPPPFSPPVPTLGTQFTQAYPSLAVKSKSLNSLPPRGLEDHLQVALQDFLRVSEGRADTGSAHSSPDLSTRRIRPARAPPQPPSPHRSPVP